MVIRPRRFQEGGAMPTEDPAMASPEEAPVEGGAPEQGEDPMMQLANMFAQGLQNQDCQMLAQGAEMFLQLIQQAQGGGAPAESAPEGEPVYRKGGKFAYRIKK